MAEQSLGASRSSGLIDTASVSNISTSSPNLNTSAANAFNIDCNGGLYGFNPNIADCERAAQWIQPDTQQLVWGERHTGLPIDTFALPFAVFGDSAECVFRVVIQGDSLTGRASFGQVKSAASALSLRCAAGGDSQGGIATNIGGDNNIAVILSAYQPNIQCGRAEIFTDAPSCGIIMAQMPASTTRMFFGPRSVADVEEPLPQLIGSPDTKCLLRIFSTGRADWASWYSIWEAAEATFAKCARNRRFGNFRGLGEHGDIFFTLGALVSPGSLGNSSVAAIV